MHQVLHADWRPRDPRRSPSEPGSREWSVLPQTMSLTEYTARSDGSSSSSATIASSKTARTRRIGNYELGELLGAGGMGAVYKARHSQFDRPRALKIIRPDLVASGGDSVVQRFYQEVRATGALEHPNLVVAIDSSSPEDEEHYLVMEYVDGVGVERLIESGRSLPVADACEIARQAALGLEHLRQRGLVHRDVKPSNLMVTLVDSRDLPGLSSGSRSGGKLPVVKLMDLGLALLSRGDEERITRLDRGGGMGTGYYMPPEQWRTTSVDIRADIYSLGCTLYHLLTGAPPFADSDLRPDRAHETEAPPPLVLPGGTPPALADLMRRMLAKNPGDRPQTPREVAEALAPLAAGARLQDAVAEARRGGLGYSSRVETQPEGATDVDTDAVGGRRLVASNSQASSASTRRSWFFTAVATTVACLAVLAAAYVLQQSREVRSASRRSQLATNAGLAADIMADAVNKRMQALSSLADQKDLREWLAAVDQDRDNEALWEPIQDWLNKVSGRYESSFQSSSWFVTDAKGRQLARSPPSNTSIGNSYAHRDYFHGEGRDQPKRPDLSTTPITAPHQSTVYRSSTSKKLKVAFSAPVFNGARKSDERRAVGVLAMSVELGKFAEFDTIEKKTKPIEILLADIGQDTVDGKPQAGLVLHHRYLQRQTTGSNSIRLPRSVLREATARRDAEQGVSLQDYPDILGRSDTLYRGAFAPVAANNLPAADRGRWIVIAQEPVD